MTGVEKVGVLIQQKVWLKPNLPYKYPNILKGLHQNFALMLEFSYIKYSVTCVTEIHVKKYLY